MKNGKSMERSLHASHSLSLGSRSSGLRTLLWHRLLPSWGPWIFLALMSASISCSFALSAWADAVPNFVRIPKDSALQSIQDMIADVSSAQLFLIAGCLIVAMEACFYVGLLRARKKHGDK